MSQDITHQELKQGIDDLMQFMVKMMEYMTDNFATKEELKDTKVELEQKMDIGFKRLENRIDEVDSHSTQNTLQIIALENKMDARFDALERRTLEDTNVQNKTIVSHSRRLTRLEKVIV